MSDNFSLFGDLDMSQVVSKGPSPTMDFWNKLDYINGKNTLGNIVLASPDFSEQLKEPGKNNGGLRYCKATPFAYGEKGYKITSSTTDDGDNNVALYWMPWKKGMTVYAERSWYENSLCKFFLTAQLSGCRFVLTERHVLHIASDVNGAQDGWSGGAMRTDAENAVTGGAKARRLSCSGWSGDQKYEKVALVFGIKRQGGLWTYKWLNYSLGSEGGDWSIFNL
jgi:hypothetical protein